MFISILKLEKLKVHLSQNLTNSVQKKISQVIFRTYWMQKVEIKENLVPCQLSLKYADTLPCRDPYLRLSRKEGILDMTQNCIGLWESSSGDLDWVDYLFISIIPSSTLSRSGSIC